MAAAKAHGTIVEVFAWSEGGVERAHSNFVVVKLWERRASSCEIVPGIELAESSTMFASFAPMDLP